MRPVRPHKLFVELTDDEYAVLQWLEQKLKWTKRDIVVTALRSMKPGTIDSRVDVLESNVELLFSLVRERDTEVKE